MHLEDHFLLRSSCIIEIKIKLWNHQNKSSFLVCDFFYIMWLIHIRNSGVMRQLFCSDMCCNKHSIFPPSWTHLPRDFSSGAANMFVCFLNTGCENSHKPHQERELFNWLSFSNISKQLASSLTIQTQIFTVTVLGWPLLTESFKMEERKST